MSSLSSHGDNRSLSKRRSAIKEKFHKHSRGWTNFFERKGTRDALIRTNAYTRNPDRWRRSNATYADAFVPHDIQRYKYSLLNVCDSRGGRDDDGALRRLCSDRDTHTINRPRPDCSTPTRDVFSADRLFTKVFEPRSND